MLNHHDGGRPSSSATTQDMYHSASFGHGDFSDGGATASSQARYATRIESLLSPVSPSLPHFDFDNIADRRAKMMSLHHLLWDNFVSVWDSRAALWLSSSCNPFLETTTGQSALLTRIVLDADYCLNKYPNGRVERDSTLDDSLRCAVYAYASRWLPLRHAFQVTRGVSEEEAQRMEQDIRNHLWRRGRASMYAAMARPSYRSILSLFLFSFTEMPADNNDRGLNHLCTEVLFSHFNYMKSATLRRKGRSLSEYTTVVPPADHCADSSLPPTTDDCDGKLEHSRNPIFWLGVICDSTRSLLQCCPSVVLPGRSGDGKVWELIRRRNVIFDQSFSRLHGSPLPLSSDVTDVVLQHALACKIMHFGMVNQFCDAAFHNTMESVDGAAQRVLEESNRFHATLGPLLTQCAQDYSSMKVENQLNYTLVLAHYHLGTLVLADALDVLDAVPETLRSPRLSRLYACNAIINAVSLALNYDRYAEDKSPYASILLRDPTPITMVETLARTAKAITLLLETEEINLPTAQMMTSVVAAALTVLSRVLVTAGFALETLRRSCEENGKIRFRPDAQAPKSPRADPATLDLLGMCDRDFIDEFLQEMKLADLSDDRTLLERTLARHESAAGGTRVIPRSFFSTDLGADEGDSAGGT